MKPRRATTLLVAAVIVAAAVGFAAGAAWLQSTIRPVAPPPPRVVFDRQSVVPAANYTPSFSSVGWLYWYSAYAGQPLTLLYDAPFPVDACLTDWPSYLPDLRDNFSECSSQPGAMVRLNASQGTIGFTVPGGSDNGFSFSALDPVGAGGRVNYTWYINNATTGAYITGGYPSNLTLPPAVLLSDAFLYVSVPLPGGFNSVTVFGTASAPVTPLFLLQPYNGWAATGTTWNYTGSYSGSQVMTVRIESALILPAALNLTVVVSDG